MAEFNEDAERAEFEAWYRDNLGFRPDMLYRRDQNPGAWNHGYYIRDWTQGQWEGWRERAERACGVPGLDGKGVRPADADGSAPMVSGDSEANKEKG